MTENEIMRLGSRKLNLLWGGLFLVIASISGAATNIPPGLSNLSLSYQSPDAAKCYAKERQVPSNQARAVMGEHNITINGPSSIPLEQAIATVANQLKGLGVANLIKGMVIANYPGGRDGKCTNYTRGPKLIQMVTDCGDGNHKRNATAQAIAPNLLHEFMHSIGQQGRYQSYFNQVPACHVTGYCKHNSNPSTRNEEFAEVGSMFVHTPQALKDHCPQAYEWFKNNIFNQQTAGACDGIVSLYRTEEWQNKANMISGTAYDTDGGDLAGGGIIGDLARAIQQMFDKQQEQEGQDLNPEVLGPVIHQSVPKTECPHPGHPSCSGQR